MDPLANAYLKVISESHNELQSKDQKVKGYTPKEGEAFGDDTNAKKIQPKSGPEAKGAETPESPQEASGNLSVGSECDGKAKALPKANYGEAKNPFDVLFNKILSEADSNTFDFATAETPADSTFEPSLDGGLEDSDEFGENEEGEDEGEQVTLTIDRSVAEKLIEVLNSALGEEGEEGEEGEDLFGASDEGESSEGESSEDESSFQQGAKPFGEAVEAEEEGHALVDAEKLKKGLDSKSNIVVKGAVPVSKKSAQTPSTGKGFDGKLKSHSTDSAVSKLTGKSNDAKGVNVGKTIFDNN
jgi:hypothetical protein